jgi:hypothetical protein
MDLSEQKTQEKPPIQKPGDITGLWALGDQKSKKKAWKQAKALCHDLHLRLALATDSEIRKSIKEEIKTFCKELEPQILENYPVPFTLWYETHNLVPTYKQTLTLIQPWRNDLGKGGRLSKKEKQTLITRQLHRRPVPAERTKKLIRLGLENAEFFHLTSQGMILVYAVMDDFYPENWITDPEIVTRICKGNSLLVGSIPHNPRLTASVLQHGGNLAKEVAAILAKNI